MKTLRKIVTVTLLAAVILTVSICSGCGYNKKAAISQAKDYIDMLNARDYQSVYDAFPEKMAKMYSLDDYKTRYDSILESAGDFVKYKSSRTFMGSYVSSGESIGAYDSLQDYEYASKSDNVPKYKYIYVIITAEHETSDITYTLVFTTDMELAELTFIEKPGG